MKYKNLIYVLMVVLLCSLVTAIDEINITIITPADGYNQSSASLYFEANVSMVNDVDCDLLLNGAVNDTVSSITAGDGVNVNYTVTTLTDGYYNVSFYCEESANSSVNETSSVNEIMIDLTAPVITITEPSSYLKTNSADIEFSAVDSSGIDALWFNYDGVNYTYTAPTEITLGAAVYAITFYANDTLGNVGSDTYTIEGRSCLNFNSSEYALYGMIFLIFIIGCVFMLTTMGISIYSVIMTIISIIIALTLAVNVIKVPMC
jgi:hypothetical protein